MMMSACFKRMHSCQNSTLVTESQPDLAVTPRTSVSVSYTHLTLPTTPYV